MKSIVAIIFFTLAAMIGINAIQTVEQLQNDKLSRFCKDVPRGSSYDEMCKDFQ